MAISLSWEWGGWSHDHSRLFKFAVWRPLPPFKFDNGLLYHAQFTRWIRIFFQGWVQSDFSGALDLFGSQYWHRIKNKSVRVSSVPRHYIKDPTSKYLLVVLFAQANNAHHGPSRFHLKLRPQIHETRETVHPARWRGWQWAQRRRVSRYEDD